MTPKQTIFKDFDRTLRNCRFYEKEGMTQCLLNEIGVLRGLAYALEAHGFNIRFEEFLYYIAVSGEMLFDERDQFNTKIRNQQKRGETDEKELGNN